MNLKIMILSLFKILIQIPLIVFLLWFVEHLILFVKKKKRFFLMLITIYTFKTQNWIVITSLGDHLRCRMYFERPFKRNNKTGFDFIVFIGMFNAVEMVKAVLRAWKKSGSQKWFSIQTPLLVYDFSLTLLVLVMNNAIYSRVQIFKITHKDIKLIKWNFWSNVLK